MRLRILLAGAVVSLIPWLLAPIGSPASTSLSDVQKKIETTQEKIGAKKGTERFLTSQITAYNRRINRLQSEITTLGVRQTRAEADLARKQELLSRTQSSLRFERARMVKNRVKLARGRRLLATRLLELYKSDRPDLVTVILNSNGFADLLEREEFISRISDQDRAVITAVRRARDDAKTSALRLGALEKQRKAVTLVVMRRRDEIASTRKQMTGTRVGLEGTKSDKTRALRSVQADRKDLEGKRDNLVEQEAKIQAALQGTSVAQVPAGPVKPGSGQLIWPVNGPITSPFCERRAWEACHPGVDIGVASGTPIRAAAAGKVALTQSAGASGGYGNFTCIAHTASLSTCYAHQSSIGVSVGQTVSQGQVIGISGCTGRCYGPHLHFEVRINGAVTNPLSYL